MRVAYSVVLLLIAIDVVAAPAPFPRRDKPSPPGTVVVDFSPLDDPTPQTDRWAIDLSVHDGLGNHRITLGNWTGVAGKGAAKWMIERIEKGLKEERSGVTVRRDRSGTKLVLLSKPPGVPLVVRVRLKGLPASQTPTVRPSHHKLDK